MELAASPSQSSRGLRQHLEAAEAEQVVHGADESAETTSTVLHQHSLPLRYACGWRDLQIHTQAMAVFIRT